VTGKQPFEAVVAAHGETVLRVCRAVLGPSDADDAWSETFLSALRAYPALPADANVRAWLVTIAHRKAIDATRATARRATPVAETPDIRSTPAADDRAAGLDRSLVDAFMALPVKQKHAVAYHYLAGLPYAEVAAILGGTTDAARRAAADGIAALRRATGMSRVARAGTGPAVATPQAARPSAARARATARATVSGPDAEAAAPARRERQDTANEGEDT
jgi:RNA polymerase sigma factor (sigma-70 family)